MEGAEEQNTISHYGAGHQQFSGVANLAGCSFIRSANLFNLYITRTHINWELVHPLNTFM